MGEVTIIGLDIAKSVFQAHGANAAGSVVFRKKLGRSRLLSFFAGQPRCTVAMEACAGAHHWGRELEALGRHDFVDRRRRPFGVPLGRVADRGQFHDPLFQGPVGGIGDSVLDRLEVPLQALIGFGGALAQIGDMAVASFDPVQAAIEDVVHRSRRAFSDVPGG